MFPTFGCLVRQVAFMQIRKHCMYLLYNILSVALRNHFQYICVNQTCFFLYVYLDGWQIQNFFLSFLCECILSKNVYFCVIRIYTNVQYYIRTPRWHIVYILHHDATEKYIILFGINIIYCTTGRSV